MTNYILCEENVSPTSNPVCFRITDRVDVFEIDKTIEAYRFSLQEGITVVDFGFFNKIHLDEDKGCGCEEAYIAEDYYVLFERLYSWNGEKLWISPKENKTERGKHEIATDLDIVLRSYPYVPEGFSGWYVRGRK